MDNQQTHANNPVNSIIRPRDISPIIAEYELRETALCLWEAYLTYKDNYPEISSLQEMMGISHTRAEFMDTRLLQACQEGWEMIYRECDYIYPFDIEFCPDFLRVCTDVIGDSLTLRENWRSLCKAEIANKE